METPANIIANAGNVLTINDLTINELTIHELVSKLPLSQQLLVYEYLVLAGSHAAHGGNVSRMAKALGTKRTTLRLRLIRHGLLKANETNGLEGGA